MTEVKVVERIKRRARYPETTEAGWDSIKMNLKEIGVNKRNLIDSSQDRDYWRALVNSR